MGWTLYLTLDKEINENIIDDIIENNIRKNLLGYSIKRRQPWGWSCIVDVRLSSFDKNKKIVLSGAAFSWEKADIFAEEMIKYLKIKGYKPKKGKLNY